MKRFLRTAILGIAILSITIPLTTYATTYSPDGKYVVVKDGDSFGVAFLKAFGTVAGLAFLAGIAFPILKLLGVVSKDALKRTVSQCVSPLPPQSRAPTTTTAEENDAYSETWDEITSKTYDQGVWAKAYAEAMGDESKANAIYIRLRVNEKLAALRAAKQVEAEPTQPTVEPVTFQDLGFIPQDDSTVKAFCLACRTTSPKNELLYCPSRDIYIHPECVDSFDFTTWKKRD